MYVVLEIDSIIGESKAQSKKLKRKKASDAKWWFT